MKKTKKLICQGCNFTLDNKWNAKYYMNCPRCRNKVRVKNNTQVKSYAKGKEANA